MKSTVLIQEIAFPECPRWHQESLWFSDQHTGVLYRAEESGRIIDRISIPGRAAGIDWLPSGKLLVASMDNRAIYAVDPDNSLSVHAELAGVHHAQSNDMVADDNGNVYAGNIGFDFSGGEAPSTTNLALVRPDGSVSVAATGMMTPNGSVIPPGGRELIVAESLANRLTRFDITSDGKLENRGVWADLGEHVPDGISLDAEGCIWLASPYAGQVLRVKEGGEILETIDFQSAKPYACMLGGSDGRTLFVCLAPDHDPAVTVARLGGSIEAVRVGVGHAGRP